MRPVVRHTAAGLLVLAVVACSTAVEAATQMTITQTYAAHKSKANPKEVFATAIKDNLYHTPNYFIGAYHYVQCYANALIEPSNTRETADAVMFYYKKTHAGQPVTFRTSRPMFHTSTKFVCPISPLYMGTQLPQGIRVPISVGLLQTRLNKVLAVDKKAFTMRVQPGMRYTELLQEAQKAGMSVQLGTPTAYAGLTLAGILATTSHGSGDRTTSAIWDTLIEITWVDGTGKVHVSKPQDPEFKGMVGGLGVYGIMTEFLMQMTPLSFTTLTTVRRNDTHMFRDINELLKFSPHILIFWRPDISSYKAYMLNKAAPGAAIAYNATATLLPSIEGKLKGAEAFKIMSTVLNDDSDAFDFLCPQQTEASLSASWASVNGEGKWNVTGPTNLMQASECDEHCNWNDDEVFYATAQDVEFTAEFDQLEEWISDVKKVFKEDLFENGKALYRCMGPGYLWIRFGSGYDGYTATNAGMKRPVFLQSTWLRSRAAPGYPMRYQFVIDLLEQLTLCKYNGRPHWGKNHERTFTYPKCGVRAKYPKFDELLKLQAKHDPGKMFEPRLFRKIVKNEHFALSPQCTLWQHCYCEQDINCPKGFKCVPSISFPEYKVCKSPMKNEPGTILPKLFATLSGNK